MEGQIEKKVVKGVLVCPHERNSWGVEITISNGIIESINENQSITQPFILPGFIDSHIHIESSMLIPSQFARLAVKHGTIAVVTDPHEVANVAGIDGIRFMIENSKRVPLKFFFGVPSCVPASPLEQSGAILNSDDVKKLIAEDDFYFLAEMMNFPGVIFDDHDVHEKLKAALTNSKPVDGHAPGLSGDQLKKYVNSGITTDHECSTIDEAKEKVALGMKILIREGSAAKNYNSLIGLLKTNSDDVMFCTDDCHPDYLVIGHINKIVARAVADGYDLYDVLKAACINPIEHYNLPIGSLDEGQMANFVVVNNLTNFDVLETFIMGESVYCNGEVKFNFEKKQPSHFSFRTEFNRGELEVRAESKKMNVIGVIDGELITKWLVKDVNAKKGELVSIDINNDLLKIVLLNRYDNSKPVVGFIQGFGLKKGAIAASIAHDSHHIISVGCDDESIENALEWEVNNRGGLCYANSSQVCGLPLPFFGLMTDADGLEISKIYDELNKRVKENGCELSSPFMTASFMALTVIPEIKIFHNGLFDGNSFKQISLFQNE